MNTSFKLTILIVILLILTGCADVVDYNVIELGAHVYGFWGGLWHGMIAGFSFIGSLFSDDIAIYAVSNNGGWYNFGFVLGGGSLFTIRIPAS